jgi:YesN/AraC family two-component response regulator
MLRALIVDDEHLARSSMRRAFAMEKTLEIVGEASSISEADTLLREKRPNIFFGHRAWTWRRV